MKNKKIIQAYGLPKVKINLKETKNMARDIIITKYEKKTMYNDEGDMVVKRIPVKVNITKKVNETARMIKEQTASEKLAELEKIFTK